MTPAGNYAARTRRHARAVARSFYEYHREMRGRPLLNPFPKTRSAEDEHLNAYHNPMEPFRRAEYQPKEPKRVPRDIPDQALNELFANRDRALIAFYISTGVRASELLGMTRAEARGNAAVAAKHTKVQLGMPDLRSSAGRSSPDS